MLLGHHADAGEDAHDHAQTEADGGTDTSLLGADGLVILPNQEQDQADQGDAEAQEAPAEAAVVNGLGGNIAIGLLAVRSLAVGLLGLAVRSLLGLAIGSLGLLRSLLGLAVLISGLLRSLLGMCEGMATVGAGIDIIGDRKSVV